MKNLSQNSRHPDQDSNPKLPEHMSEPLTFEPPCSLQLFLFSFSLNYDLAIAQTYRLTG
jgi:hypothetical protein